MGEWTVKLPKPVFHRNLRNELAEVEPDPVVEGPQALQVTAAKNVAAHLTETQAIRGDVNEYVDVEISGVCEDGQDSISINVSLSDAPPPEEPVADEGAPQAEGPIDGLDEAA